jgi:hypothetical protein
MHVVLLDFAAASSAAILQGDRHLTEAAGGVRQFTGRKIDFYVLKGSR